MSRTFKDRHLYGAGAAACAVCCAAPLVTLLGVAGTAATVATFVFAGAIFGLVVAAGALLAVWNQRRQKRAQTCHADVQPGPVDIELSTAPPEGSPGETSLRGT